MIKEPALPKSMPCMGFIETQHLSIILILADAVVKSAEVRLLGIEPNGTERITIHLGAGQPDSMQAALDEAETHAEKLGASIVTHILPAADPGVRSLTTYPNVLNGIYGGREELLPTDFNPNLNKIMSQKSQAIGIIETQGFTAMMAATDTMLKSANVELIGKEKIGAAYITVIVRGDVAAVQAAVDAGAAAVGSLGKLISTHVIPRPHSELCGIMPPVPVK